MEQKCLTESLVFLFGNNCKYLIIFITSMLFSANVYCAVWYVDPSIDPNSPTRVGEIGGETNPFITISEMEKNSYIGDIVYVRNMDYYIENESAIAANHERDLTKYDWPDREYRTNKVSQFGITWTFDADYRIGQFANHDMWVTCPVIIQEITPNSRQLEHDYIYHNGLSYRCIKSHYSDSKSEPGIGSNSSLYWEVGGSSEIPWSISKYYHDNRIVDGSMYNPEPSDSNLTPQGFDDALQGGCIYDSKLNVGMKLPIFVDSAKTIASSISNDIVASRYYLKSISLLTVLESPASYGDFRPFYNNASKDILFNKKTAFKNNTLLENLNILDVPVAIPDADNHLQALHKDYLYDYSNVEETVERFFERAWLIFNRGPNNAYFAPIENNKEYARDRAAHVGIASLMLNSDLSGNGKSSWENKKTLLIRFLQTGIDMYGIASSDSGRTILQAAAGHTQGNKWPILFAGLMLDYDPMKNIGKKTGDFVYDENGNWIDPTPSDYIHFGEDDQTFYVGDDQIYNRPYELYVFHKAAENGTVHVENGSKTVKLNSGDWLEIGRSSYWKQIVFKTTTNIINQYDRKYLIESVNHELGTLEITEPYEGESSLSLYYEIGEKIWYGHGNASDNTIGKEDYPEYIESHRGMPEWGERHGGREQVLWFMADTPDWTRQYRRSCTANSFTGFVLAALIMGQKEQWNHNALFDYMDRFIQVQEDLYRTSTKKADGKYYGYTKNILMRGDYKDGDLIQDYKSVRYITQNDFVYAMWKKYRNAYGLQWPYNGENQLPTARIAMDMADQYITPAKDETVSIEFDGSGSYDLDGTIASYSWSCPGQSATSGQTTSYDLTAGTYTASLVVTDNEGAESSPASVTFTVVDPVNQFPTATITSPSDNASFTAASKSGVASVSFTGTATDPDGTISSYAWSCSGQTTKNGDEKSYNLTAGAYTFTLTVTDNEGATATDQVTVTVADPPNAVPTLSISPSGNKTVAEKATVTFDVIGDDTDAVDSLTYACIDKPANASFNELSGRFSWTPNDEACENGPIYTVKFTVSDGEATCEPVSVDITVTNVNQPPVAITGPDQVHTANTKTSAVAVDLDGTGSNDPDSAGSIASYLWHCTNNAEVADKTGASPNYSLKPGSYLFTLTVTDNEGATDTSDYMSVIIKSPENHAPEIVKVDSAAFTGTQITRNVSENTTFTLTFEAADLDAGDSLTYGYTSIPVGASFNATERKLTWPINNTAAESGPHIAKLTADDGYGGIVTLTVNFVVANVNIPPAIANITPQSFKEQQEGQFALTATDEDGDTNLVFESDDNAQPGNVAPNGTYTWTPGYEDAGTHILRFKVTDSLGAVGTKEVVVTVEDTNRPAALSSATSYSCDLGIKLKFTPTADDPDGNPVTITCVSKPDGSAFDGTFAWTPGVGDDGIHDVILALNDGKETKEETIKLSIGLANLSPSLEPLILESTYAEGENLTFDARGSDPEGKKITYSLSGAVPDGAAIDPTSGHFSWPIGFNAAGPVTFTVIASDGELTAQKTLSFVVTNTNQLPAINISGATTFDYKDGLDLSFSATDPDADNLTFSSSSLPAGAVFDINNGKVTWATTADNVGSHSFNILVTDGRDTVTRPVTVVVTSNDIPNDPPVFTPVKDITVNQGEELDIVIAASDPDNDPVTITSVSLPQGAVFVNNTFTWDTSMASGVFNPVFAVSDDKLSTNLTFTITVNAVNTAPAVEAIKDFQADALKTVSVKVIAVDTQNDLLSYSFDKAPEGMTIADNNISWTPSLEQIGDNLVSVIVSDGEFATNVTFTINVLSTETDNDPPVLISTTPKDKAIQIPLNPLVTIIVADYGIGVDLSTVEISLDGDTIYSGAAMASVPEGEPMLYSTSNSSCICKGNSSRYVFQYQALGLFDYDYRPTVTINASDLNGNAMEPYSFAFTTEMYSMCAAVPVEESKSGSASQQSSPDSLTASDGTIWSAWDDGLKISVSPYSEDLGYFDTARSIQTNGKQLAPVLAQASDDTLYVAWQDYSARNWDIYVARSTDGRNFTDVKAVTTSQEDQVSPVLDVADDGTVYIAYVSKRKTGEDIYLAALDADLSTVIETVVCNNTSKQQTPVIDCSADGNVVIAWEDYRSGVADVYIADKDSGWNALRVAQNAYEPDIAVDNQQNTVHATWASDGDIFYAKLPLPLSAKSVNAVNVIDDSSGAVQFSPSITHSYVNGREKTFVAWSDSRNNTGNGDNDIYFASVNGSASTNILATLDSSLTDQGLPSIGATGDGAPYVLFQDNTASGKSVQLACATVVKAVLQRRNIVPEEGGCVGIPAEEIDSLDDVSILVRPEGISSDVEFTISLVSNPPGGSSGLRSIFSYDFGPSSTREFRKPVTITIPYPAVLDGSTVSVYWYNPQTGSYSQTGMSNIKVVSVGNNIKAISFDTTHFCQYSVSTDDEFLPYMINTTE